MECKSCGSKILVNSNLENLPLLKNIATISNANDANKVGVYRLNKGATNVPKDIGGNPWMLFNTGSSNRIQIAWAYYALEANYEIYVRSLNDNWSPWRKIATETPS